MFEKKAPKGIEGDKGGPGEKTKIPVADSSVKPKKKSKKKPKKHSVAKEGQKGKIAAMLGSKFGGKELAFTGKRGPANQFGGSNAGMTMGAKAGVSGDKDYC